MILGLAALPFLVLGAFNHGHGHIHEPLEVTVRVLDATTGEPLAGAVVVVVPYRSQLERESFAWHVGNALEHSADARAYPFAAARSGDDTTLVRSATYVTRYWFAGVQTSKEVGVPDFLVVVHPRHGRKVVPIDENALRPGPEKDTWRIDLGTVRVP